MNGALMELELSTALQLEEKDMRSGLDDLAVLVGQMRKELNEMHARLDEGVHSFGESLSAGSRAFENDLKLAQRVTAIEDWIVRQDELLEREREKR